MKKISEQTMKRKGTIIAAFALVCLMLAACIIEHDLPNLAGGGGRPNGLWGNWFPVENNGEVQFVPFSGTVRGSAPGYNAGNITIDIVVEYGIIQRVNFITTAGQQSLSVTLANARINDLVRTTNGFGTTDALTNATGTLRGVREAARRAFRAEDGIYDEFVNW